MSQMMLWEDEQPVVLPVRPSIVSTPAEMPEAWLWTARYQNKAVSTYGLAAVRTTLYPPRFRLGYPIVANLQEMAPTRTEFAMTDPEMFQRSYRGRLDAVGYDAIVGRLRTLHEQHGRPLVLLCFERIGESCHRFELSRWLGEHGLSVPELQE